MNKEKMNELVLMNAQTQQLKAYVGEMEEMLAGAQHREEELEAENESLKTRLEQISDGLKEQMSALADSFVIASK
jgi:hypothetical protein